MRNVEVTVQFSCEYSAVEKESGFSVHDGTGGNCQPISPCHGKYLESLSASTPQNSVIKQKSNLIVPITVIRHPHTHWGPQNCARMCLINNDIVYQQRRSQTTPKGNEARRAFKRFAARFLVLIFLKVSFGCISLFATFGTLQHTNHIAHIYIHNYTHINAHRTRTSTHANTHIKQHATDCKLRLV